MLITCLFLLSSLAFACNKSWFAKTTAIWNSDISISTNTPFSLASFLKVSFPCSETTPRTHLIASGISSSDSLSPETYLYDILLISPDYSRFITSGTAYATIDDFFPAISNKTFYIPSTVTGKFSLKIILKKQRLLELLINNQYSATSDSFQISNSQDDADGFIADDVFLFNGEGRNSTVTVYYEDKEGFPIHCEIHDNLGNYYWTACFGEF